MRAIAKFTVFYHTRHVADVPSKAPMKVGDCIDVFDEHPKKRVWCHGSIADATPDAVKVHFKVCYCMRCIGTVTRQCDQRRTYPMLWLEIWRSVIGACPLQGWAPKFDLWFPRNSELIAPHGTKTQSRTTHILHNRRVNIPSQLVG